jgi:hypothetical protein
MGESVFIDLSKKASRASLAALFLFWASLPSSASTNVRVRAAVASARPAATYKITPLGEILGSSIQFIPTALNDSGQIVGYDDQPQANGDAGPAYLINANGTFGVLDNTGNAIAYYIPVAISNDGRSVVGNANDPGNAYGVEPYSGPVTWSLIGTTKSHQNYRVFAKASEPATYTIADIASGNVPVGGADFFGFKTYGVTPFKSSGCAAGAFFATAVNDAGTIVGNAAGYAAFDTLTGCAAPIPGLPQPANASTSAIAIDSNADVLFSVQGPAAPAFGAYYLFAKKTITAVTLPPTLSSSTYYLTAVALNDAGQVVGNVAQQVPPFAPVAPFLYQSGRSVDVNSLLPAKSGWRLVTATAINDAGEIIGTGYLSGVFEGYALSP